MSGVTQEIIDTATRIIEQLWTDYQRLNARCERLEGELIELRERLRYASDFECINPNEPVESA